MLEFPAAAPRFCARHVAGALVSLITACVIDVAVGPACAVAAGRPCPPAIVLLLGHSNPTAVPFTVDSPVYDSTYVPGLYESAHLAFARTQGRMFVSTKSTGRNFTSVRIVEPSTWSGFRRARR